MISDDLEEQNQQMRATENVISPTEKHIDFEVPEVPTQTDNASKETPSVQSKSPQTKTDLAPHSQPEGRTVLPVPAAESNKKDISQGINWGNVATAAAKGAAITAGFAVLGSVSPLLFAGVAGGMLVGNFLHNIAQADRAGAGEGAEGRALIAAISGLAPGDPVTVVELVENENWITFEDLSESEWEDKLGNVAGGLGMGLGIHLGARGRATKFEERGENQVRGATQEEHAKTESPVVEQPANENSGDSQIRPRDNNTYVGRNVESMRRNAAAIIGRNPNHPLRFLLDPSALAKGEFKFLPLKNRSHANLADHPEIVEMGHITSKKSGQPEQIMLQAAWLNQFNNVTIETGSTLIFAENPVVDIGGVAVDAKTAAWWRDIGWIQ